jgi:hypothetical protein
VGDEQVIERNSRAGKEDGREEITEITKDKNDVHTCDRIGKKGGGTKRSERQRMRG